MGRFEAMIGPGTPVDLTVGTTPVTINMRPLGLFYLQKLIRLNTKMTELFPEGNINVIQFDDEASNIVSELIMALLRQAITDESEMVLSIIAQQNFEVLFNQLMTSNVNPQDMSMTLPVRPVRPVLPG